MKRCTCCKIDKDDSSFRTRTEKRRNYNFKYLNNTCRSCDAKKTRERHAKLRNDLDYKLKNTKNATDYRNRNKERVRLLDKERRQRESSKKLRKNYIERNRDKIYQQEKICKERYYRKHADNLTDNYIAHRLFGKNLTEQQKQDKNTILLIEAKRLQLKILRLNNN